MKLGTYLRLWLYTACRHSLGIVDLWSGLAGGILAAAVHFLPQPQAARLNNLDWQVPFLALGVVMAVRLVLAPFWLYRDLKKDYSTLEQRIAARDAIEAALTSLADIWENGTRIRNSVAEKNPPTEDDIQLVKDLENQIYSNVGAIAKSEVGLFRTINHFDITKHAVEFQRHPFLLYFSERLLRLKPFIERHQPGAVINPR